MHPAYAALIAVTLLAFLAFLVARSRLEEAELASEYEPDDGTFAFPLDGTLAPIRALRRSYDDLPYRGGRGWSDAS